MNKLIRNVPLVSLIGASVYLSTAAVAQIAPSTGQILRDVQTEPLTIPQRQQIPLEIKAEVPILDGAAAASIPILVNRIEIEGSTGMSSEQLQPLLADLINKQVTLTELQQGAAKIRQYYREKGYPLVLAYIPEQVISDGVVKMVVLEGRYGNIHVTNNTDLNPSVASPIELLKTGDVITAPALDKSLLLVAEQPGVIASSILRAGADTGTADLDVTIEKAKQYNGSVYLDNYGNKYTGEYRLGGIFNLYNPLKRGDQLNLEILGTNESQYYGRVSYQIPINKWGTQVGAGFSYLDYTLGDNFKVLDATGTAANTRVFFTQPLILQRDKKLSFGMQFENKELRDKYKAIDYSSPKNVKIVTAMLDGTRYDNAIAGGVTRGLVTVGYGNLTLDNAADRVIDDATAKTAGNFALISFNLLRLQKLNDKWSLYGRLAGQMSDKNLNSSEKMSLGGAYGVRAYPQGEASGDVGLLGTAEVRYQINPMWQASAFVDVGTMQINKDQWDNNAKNNRTLSAAGLGAQMKIQDLTVDASFAYRLSSGERSLTENNDDSYRIWVRALWQF
jgi:hemolysin activation/secretion protein